MNERRSVSRERLPALVMTVLALVYPLISLRYFWEDWFRYFKLKAPMLVEASGFVIQTTDGRFTLLSPWRLLEVGVSTVLLWSAARRLRRQEPGARAFSLIMLLGVLLPQVLWYGELSLDWFRGQHFFSWMLGGMAAVLLPASLLASKGRATEGWGKFQGASRVLRAAVGLGWLGFFSMSFLEHLHYFYHPLRVGGMALLTLTTAVAGMVGLYRQRAWGVLAAVSSVGSLAGLTAILTAEQAVPWWSLLNVFVQALAGTPLRALGTISFASLALITLLGPFLRGFWRKMRGVEPINSGATFVSESTFVPELMGAGAAWGAQRVQEEASGAAKLRVSTQTTLVEEEEAFLEDISAEKEEKRYIR